MTTKYTQELIDQLVAAYKESPTLETVDKLATSHQIPRRSIISKLSALGVYQKKQYTTKEGTLPVKKEYYIEEISELLDIDIQLLESLEKCTKMSLKLIVEGINQLKVELSSDDPKLQQ